jgi:hypothetical protein
MKFKVGDLVMLSAAGRGVGQNSHAIGGWGIIKEITKHHYQNGVRYEDLDSYPIKTQWYDGDGYSRRSGICFKPYELKFFKKVP